MGFFDLNIPYLESDKHCPNKAALKTARLKLSLQSVSLGYSGIAYNRTIKSIMSESDRCSMPTFPLSSLVKLSNSLSSSARFRREILRVPVSGPFRQYKRVTVVVENSAQAAGLNSGNLVLKSYDLVAVRPMNQNAFETACTASEVDLISIDFSEKLPFRLKQHMVKAAIERGIYFEIAYSALLMDVQMRRQMITNSKLLVGWTRGKNLIISSAAPSVTEMRGPFDVANLSSLLGLSMEHAKAALSKNCRSLIAKALRKKHYHKEAIRVEIIPSGEECDSNEHWPKEWMKWDPISSGEGDLFLDDMAKSFSAANKVAKTVNPIDFASIMDKLPSHGLQIQELRPMTETTTNSFKTDSFVNTEPETVAKSFIDSSECRNSLHISPSQHQNYSCEDFVKLIPSTHTQGYLSNIEKTVTHTADEDEKHNDSDGLGVHVSSLGTETLCLQSENCIRRCDTQVDMATIDSSVMDIDIIGAREAVFDAENSCLPITGVSLINMRTSSHSGVALGSQDNEMKSVITEMNLEVEQDLLPTSCELIYTENGNLNKLTAVPDAITDASPVRVSSCGEKYENDHIAMKEVSVVADTETNGDSPQTPYESNGENGETKDAPVASPVLVTQDEINDSSQIIVISEPSSEVTTEEQTKSEDHAQSSSPVILLNGSSGKRKRNPRMTSQACVFPFKRLLNRTPFKRKSKPKSRSKLL